MDTIINVRSLAFQTATIVMSSVTTVDLSVGLQVMVGGQAAIKFRSLKLLRFSAYNGRVMKIIRQSDGAQHLNGIGGRVLLV